MAHVTFIHGIANKPAEPELLRIWRDALVDGSNPLPLGDHGVTSTMVYWADLMYPAQETPCRLPGTAGRHRLRPAKKHDRADLHPRPPAPAPRARRPQAPETAGNGAIHAPVHRSCAPRTAEPVGARAATMPEGPWNQCKRNSPSFGRMRARGGFRARPDTAVSIHAICRYRTSLLGRAMHKPRLRSRIDPGPIIRQRPITTHVAPQRRNGRNPRGLASGLICPVRSPPITRPTVIVSAGVRAARSVAWPGTSG